MPTTARAKKKKTKAKAPRKKAKSPRRIVFAGSRTVEKKLAGDRMHLDLDGSVPVIPVMCSGRLSAAILLKAIRKGADGVLVAGCRPDECRFGFGSRHAMSVVTQTKNLLRILGIEEERAAFSDDNSLGEAYTKFRKLILKLGALK